MGAAVLGCLVMGCSTVQVVLKAPIQDRCSEAGLRGCSEMTDGVLAYIDGDKATAEEKIKHGAAKNAPDQVREFAGKLRALKGLPGVDDYLKPLFEVADLLAPEEKGAHPRAKATTQASAVAVERLLDERGPGTEEERRAPSTVVELPTNLAGTSVPAMDTRSRKCLPYAESTWESPFSTGRCVTIANGPGLLTDVQTTGACHDLLAIGAGDPQDPAWVLISEPSTPLSIHGAKYLIGDSQSIFIVQQGANVDALSHGLECSISWGIESRPPRSAR